MTTQLGDMTVFITGNIIDFSRELRHFQLAGDVISPLSTGFSPCCGSYLYMLINNL